MSKRTRPIRIAPSILDANFCELAREIETVESAGAELLHLDVMDGHFVPNLSIGVPIVKAVASCTDLFLDTHLMIERPDRYAAPFVEAGADSITFHIEVADQPRELIKLIRGLGAKVGVSLNPGTPAGAILEIIDDVDIVLIMTVWPGFGGQKFISDCIEKIEQIAARLTDKQWLEVDGGINLETAGLAVAAGADTLVAGSAIFRGGNAAENLRLLRKAAQPRPPEAQRPE
jgi:ribulose-phosphate 3-epimerase